MSTFCNSNKKNKKRIIEVKFLDKKNDIYKIISFFAKKAREVWLLLLLKTR